MHSRISYSIVIKVMDVPVRLHNGNVHHITKVSLQCKNTFQISYSQWLSLIFCSFSYLSQGSELLNGKILLPFIDEYTWTLTVRTFFLYIWKSNKSNSNKWEAFFFLIFPFHLQYTVSPDLVKHFFQTKLMSCAKIAHGDFCLQNENMI